MSSLSSREILSSLLAEVGNSDFLSLVFIGFVTCLFPVKIQNNLASGDSKKAQGNKEKQFVNLQLYKVDTACEKMKSRNI